MTILNHITLEALVRLPVAEIVALPPTELSRLQKEAEKALRQAKLTVAWLDGALNKKYAERAKAARADAGKDFGVVRLTDDGVTVVADTDKKVEWDQGQLSALMERIAADGENPRDYVEVTATGINSLLPNPAAITPVTPGAWIVVCAGAAHNASVTTGYTTQGLTTARSSTAGGGTGTNRMANGIGYKSDWVSGTYDPPAWTIAITDSTSFSWAAVTLALRPAPL